MGYDPQKIEKKWQEYWKKARTFAAKEEPNRQKYYVLDMFPYPSGSGLHVGHLVGYTATDVIARYKFARHYSVLHPMGWDSFGLPAEQYAIRTGTHPLFTTHANIKNFKIQLERVGYAYDWEREIRTSDPKYYKWTQWIFTKLYERGLAYQAELLVNWCPALGTVLANEEVENGLSKEGGHPVERRPLRQWVLKITEYADRLLQDLDLLEWPEGLKRLQRNWIGRSEGALIHFAIEGSKEKISVFTTAPHTLFGVTFLVLSPEHPLLATITQGKTTEEVAAYQRRASAKSDLERTDLAKEKTGVFTGSYVLHPVTGERVPIWVADYVLMSYGTGAVMGVAAHDERDREFAERYGLPLLSILEEGRVVNSQGATLTLNGLSAEEAGKKVISWLEKEGRGEAKVSYRLRDWLFSRQRYWGEPIPLLHFADGSVRPLDLDELPLEPPEIVEYKPSPTGESPLAKAKEWVSLVDPKRGKAAQRETNTMPQWAGSCWYYLRFCDPHNEARAWDPEREQYWMPVDLYVGGAEHAVLHLLYARFWHKVLYDCGLVSTLEPFRWLVNQGLVVARAYRKPGGNYVAPEEVVEREGGYYHWETGEPLVSQIEKMSKSKLNGVSPDAIIEEQGADALRLYSLFMGPIEKEKVWHTQGVAGCRRFLSRFFDLVTSDKVGEEESPEALSLIHALIEGVTQDTEKLLFNTAISKMMEFLNHFTKLPTYPRCALRWATQLLAPFAPHLAEELWEYLGEQPSVTHHPWPKADPRYLVKEEVLYIIQVNGKLRGRLRLPKDQTKEALVAEALQDPAIAKYVQGAPRTIIFVPNTLLNFVC